ncbi:MAG: BCCT family transporter [Leptospiraceae bacterium]|nr:BCCT family transporter [Leptospiraceae bacterium]
MKNLFSRLKIDAHPTVFPAGAILAVNFVLLSSFFPARSLMILNLTLQFITQKFSWLYILSMTGFLAFILYLLFSRFGNLRLGDDNSRPEFSRLSWLAMLFSAGMGIGMLFYGVVEPVTHYMNPVNGEAQTMNAARDSMSTTLLHWCLHPWALYALVGLSLAYFSFRKKLPLSFRSLFYPLFGHKIYGWRGNIIDTLAVLATLFGLATSLGLGAKQVNAGLNFVFGWPTPGVTSQIIIIACITILALLSLVSGLDIGIKWLSNINMGIALFILIFLFITGPTMYLLGAITENTGNYLIDLIHRSFWTSTYSSAEKTEWFSAWTVFYWGWWIAWSPFVGMFIARISKGRTIREFILGVLAVPSVIALIWFTVFGNSSLKQISDSQIISRAQQTSQDLPEYPVAIFDTKLKLPITQDLKYAVAKLGPGETRILIQRNFKDIDQNADYLMAASGEIVTRKNGVLIDSQTNSPLKANEKNTFTDRYAFQNKQLNLGQFLEAPVLQTDQKHLLDTNSTAMFVMFKAFPGATLLILLGVCSIVLFFVTSSDSASLVADILASGGKHTPGVGTRLFWGILEGALAASLLLAGGLKALQAGAISLGLPFCIVIILVAIGLYRSLCQEKAAKIEAD